MKSQVTGISNRAEQVREEDEGALQHRHEVHGAAGVGVALDLARELRHAGCDGLAFNQNVNHGWIVSGWWALVDSNH